MNDFLITGTVPNTERSQSSQSIVSSVTETHSVTREFDESTGHKIVNQYMLLKELGRGFHGKVKLALDMDTNTYWV